jgi:hypothetical protein
MLHVVANDIKLEASLSRYLKSEFCKNVRFEDDAFVYKLPNGAKIKKCGIHSKLKKRYYPRFEYRKKRAYNRQHKSSDTEEGIKVGAEIETYIEKGVLPEHCFAQAVIDFLEKTKKHHLVASEVPIRVKKLDCITKADILSQDSRGRLWLWELKCGYPNIGARGKLCYPLHSVPNTRFNHYELQRHFTAQAFIASNVNIYKSAVLHVYTKKDKGVQVKIRPAASWTKKHLNPR